MCACPRANQALHTLPLSSEFRGYAAAHDEASILTLQASLGGKLLADRHAASPISHAATLEGGAGRAAPSLHEAWLAYARDANSQHPLLRARSSTRHATQFPSAPATRSGPQAGTWLDGIPTEPVTTFPPCAMQIALRRRLRQHLPLHSSTCGPPHGCGGEIDRFGYHALACPRDLVRLSACSAAPPAVRTVATVTWRNVGGACSGFRCNRPWLVRLWRHLAAALLPASGEPLHSRLLLRPQRWTATGCAPARSSSVGP